MTGPLTDLRVIEYCDEAGAWAGKLFADMGADVVKVEPPGGSRVRGYPPFLGDEPHPDRSLAFWHNNTSKRAITLDLEQEAGREVFRRLAAGAAIVLEDQSPGQMAELGLDYPDLSALNPGLIMVSITPYGRSGPKSDWVATDLTVLAGGPEWSNGYDDHSLPPVRGLGNQGYQTACHWAVATALVAVLHRDWTGEGQHVDANMHAGANVTTEASSYTWLVARQTVQRQTGRHATVVPSSPLQILAKDGRYVTTGVAPRRPREIASILAWLDDLALRDAFTDWPLLEAGANLDHNITIAAVAEGGEEAAIYGAVRDALNFIAEQIDSYDFFVGTQTRGFQCGIIYSPDEVFEDPHFVARGFQVPVEHPELGQTFRYPGAPYGFAASPWAISRRPPLVGEHTAEVLAEAGVTPEEFERLRTAGVV
ncbi:MAG: CoA transferase [Dehalococcoidia bacterium]|nr:CoA transferase [Dehalococcoidia bacterium]